MKTNVLSRPAKSASTQPYAPTASSKRTVNVSRALRDAVAVAPDEAGYPLNIAGIYQDSVTRDWAMQTCRLATQLVGEEHVQSTWYNVHSLGDPENLLDAVRAAIVADVIVVSVYAADELPLELYVWIDVWLPRRLPRTGALAVLVGAAEPSDSQAVRTHEYLQAVARRGQLDYIPQERRRFAGSPGFLL